MLWNTTLLPQETFRAIVNRFGDAVDGFMLEDCYHSEEVPGRGRDRNCAATKACCLTDENDIPTHLIIVIFCMHVYMI